MTLCAREYVGADLIQNVVDVAAFRSIDPGATEALATRLNGYLADQGMRGNGFLSCYPIATDAQPAERYTVTVR